MQQSRRSLWTKLFKYLLIIAVVVSIWYLDIIKASTIARILSQPVAFALSVAALIATIQLSVIRWHLLLRVHGQVIPIGRLTKIVYISYFLGGVTLGTLGVDALRLYYTGRESHESLGQAYLSIAADRLIGLFGLIVVGTLFFAADYHDVLQHAQIKMVAILSLLAGLSILFIGVLIVVLERFIAPLFQHIHNFVRVRTHLRLLIDYYRLSPGRLSLCLGISIIIQLATLASLLILAQAILRPSLSGLQLGLAGVMATIANQIPITPGGLAIGESIFAYLCRLMDPVHVTSDYGSVVFLQRIVGLVAVLPGLIFYLIDRRSKN